MKFSEAENYFYSLQPFGIKLGLERISRLFELLGNPHKRLKFVHIAGSNGKGSTGAMLAAGLKATGLKTGFYTSPHLVYIRERFRIGGNAISEERFADITGKLHPHIEAMRNSLFGPPTFFEALTALAVIYFLEEKTDAVIWETGMGGRFDATNIVDPLCSVITGISLEHCGYLGDTIEKIAFEKAGIIKEKRPVFCGRLSPSCREVIMQKASELSAPSFFIDKPFDGAVSLYGEFQNYNASLAAAVLEYLSGKMPFDLHRALEAFSLVRWPGRMQFLPDGTIIDGAHNPESSEVLAAFIKEHFPDEKFTVIFGNFADKDTLAVLKFLEPVASSFIFVPIKGERKCRQPDELVQMLLSFSEKEALAAESLEDAISISRGKKTLISGSLYLSGEALKLLVPPEAVLNI